jgi:hypothetical protein
MSLASAVLLAAILDPRIPPLLERVTEEARVFTEKSPKFLGVETLVQKGRIAPPRFRLRKGVAASEAPTIAYRTTELVSEYGFGYLPALPGQLKEIRVVVSVNGRPVRDHEKTRLALSEGMASDFERLNKQMLQDMESYGLVGAVLDVGQILMLFSRSRLDELELSVLPDTTLDGEPIAVLGYRQTGGVQATIFHRETARLPLEGELWIRRSDGVPVRITSSMSLKEGKYSVVHRFAVDYAASKHGILLPSKTTYSRRQDSVLMVETEAAYTDYKMFSAETEIKFVAEGDQAQ